MAKRQTYSFMERKHSANGIASALLSVLSLLVLGGLLAVSYVMRGMAASWIGAAGFAGILMAIGGVLYGFAGFKDDCKTYVCCKIGTILGTAVIAAWFFIVCIGIVNG